MIANEGKSMANWKNKPLKKPKKFTSAKIDLVHLSYLRTAQGQQRAALSDDPYTKYLLSKKLIEIHASSKSKKAPLYCLTTAGVQILGEAKTPGN